MNNKTLVFPQRIHFEDVSNFVETFNSFKDYNGIIFDLSQTEEIHSSFVGFLINSKDFISKKNGSLILIVSYTTEKILKMLHLLPYFSNNINTKILRKTA